MNKTALKNFATNARKELIEKVKARAFKIGITEENIKKTQFESSDAIYIDGKQLSATERKQREKLISRIKEIGYKQVIEEVAYTWFNRFTALRFMEVNNYLPTKVRVLSSSNVDSSEPDIIKEALTVDLDIDKELVYDLKLNNKTEELFKYLVIKQCNSLNKVLSFMFETIEDYKEILFPEGLLVKDSFLREMTDIEKIPELDWEHVEIIGWLYQYYIEEEKDRVIKAKQKYKSEEIPFATQLFTPDWIVRYMVQNTLGRYWVESHPEHHDLIKNWEFFLEDPNPVPDFKEKLASHINKELKVEEIKCFDPAMGSGHILVYMFDVLFEIYSKCGYLNREIPRLIIENNLYGLEIDNRAYQLACFSIVMKAQYYNPRFLRSLDDGDLTINLASIEDSNQLDIEEIILIAQERVGNNFEKTKAFIQQFENAKIYGSLINVYKYDVDFLKERSVALQNENFGDILDEISRLKIVNKLPVLLKQADIMSREYDILVTNPPYMGNRYMNEALNEFIGKNYVNTKYDLFSAFSEYCLSKVNNKGHIGLMTPFVWMFISSYEKLREMIISKSNVSSLVQLEYSAFEEATVPICTFTLRNYQVDINGQYIKLSNFSGSKNQPIKVIESIQNPKVDYRYSLNSVNFSKIPSSPFAFWSSDRVIEIFEENPSLGELARPRVGQNTGDNKRFLRQWYEIEFKKIGFGIENRQIAIESQKKWFPYNKGGKYKKWYGNNDYVVNWENDGEEIKEYAVKRNNGKHWSRYIQNLDFIFKEGITWSDISSSKFGVRYSKTGFIFDVTGSMAFPEKKNIYYLMAFLCSKLSYEFLMKLNPTMHFQTGNIANLPSIIPKDSSVIEKISRLAKENIELAKLEWDSFELSWEFSKHPFLQFRNNCSLISEAFNNWILFGKQLFEKTRNNEEEINREFINIYQLNEEMTPVVDETDITIRLADRERDVKSFVSYAVGCMFGRFSLDVNGLVYSGGIFEQSIYKTYHVDSDNIIPVLSESYFEDEALIRFVEFVRITFGDENLIENLDFIAVTLGKKEGEIAKETIRRYILNDFFKDHTQVYKKRPIYWLFTSGKQKAFNCLIYMHRYEKSTLSRIRTDYLHELQIRMDAEKKTLLDIINGDGTTKEISNAKKELKSLDLKIEELRAYDEKLHHMADMQIEIDLDDGVAVNYAKFEGLLAPIK